MTSNRNPIKQFLVTIPHSSISELHPYADLSKQAAAADFKRMFSLEHMTMVEESHHDNVGKHLHILMSLKKKMTKINVLRTLQTQYSWCSARIDVQACRRMYATFLYLTVPNSSGGRPKSAEDIDPEPIKYGTDIKPPGSFTKFGQSDWNKLLRSMPIADRVNLQPNWELAKSGFLFLNEDSIYNRNH